MSLYNFILSGLIILFSFTALAQEQSAAPRVNDDLTRPYARTTWALSYISWTELADFESATNGDKGFANLYGNAISYEKEYYRKRYSGFAFQIDLLNGQANIGGSQTNVTYQESYKKFFGAMAQARYVYRMNSAITASVGPFSLYRQVEFPTVNGVSAKAGSALNYGLIAVLGARLGRNWEFRQSFGTMAFKASTIWSVGIGYKY